ncbi:hypothetical protein BD410DRAFT_436206 [Rickenella mellea]|uniref:Uncharacterized protein n=1 Tax=Rickenella mellea TaxID=50990 RepID=A0A4Y7PVN4_9AGAM|nr:hypothetical protein BD410DRAFT_436206 [Rickenella mellea]
MTFLTARILERHSWPLLFSILVIPKYQGVYEMERPRTMTEYEFSTAISTLSRNWLDPRLLAPSPSHVLATNAPAGSHHGSDIFHPLRCDLMASKRTCCRRKSSSLYA